MFCLIDPMSRCGESMHQPIIPGLPDDLGMRCLAMLSHGYHGVMETVSKRWRDVMRSEEYANLKAREGWCGDWLFVLPKRSRDQWILAYDPEADRWHPLPPTPVTLYSKTVLGCHCACNKFLVTGNTYNKVFRFDPFKKEWSTGASMRTPRLHFASCTLDGKVYVAGGYELDYPDGMNLAEVYDPLTDKWEDLPPMPVPMDTCIGIAYKGKFHVISAFPDHQGLSQIQVFDPLSRSWRVKHESWSRRPNELTVVDDQVYSIFGVSSTCTVQRRDAEKEECHIVGEVPPPFHPNHSKQHAQFYNVPLASLGHELYVIGGRYYMVKDSKLEETGDLDRVRVCDPRYSPLIWRDARPMCLSALGYIAGWASLKQQ